MPSAHETAKKWENIHHALTTLVLVDFGTPVAKYEGKSNGGWIYLEGFTVKLGLSRGRGGSSLLGTEWPGLAVRSLACKRVLVCSCVCSAQSGPLMVLGS
ncbi:hypothetical protein CLV40_10695 [Actinokineospora auranticolor]|uniref:Uncharacterized protein n=1 Tax=Actinokineospora auranticolor TaxID=155976 RepID=A0A2S6GRH8_9PSEU|nr:hypothetical protein CLV40_10695 [Actinokineospora auranticolor]